MLWIWGIVFDILVFFLGVFWFDCMDWVQFIMKSLVFMLWIDLCVSRYSLLVVVLGMYLIWKFLFCFLCLVNWVIVFCCFGVRLFFWMLLQRIFSLVDVVFWIRLLGDIFSEKIIVGMFCCMVVLWVMFMVMIVLLLLDWVLIVVRWLGCMFVVCLLMLGKLKVMFGVCWCRFRIMLSFLFISLVCLNCVDGILLVLIVSVI